MICDERKLYVRWYGGACHGLSDAHCQLSSQCLHAEKKRQGFN